MRFFKMVLASALGYLLAAVVVLGLVAILIVSIASNAKPEVNIQTESVLNLKLNYYLQDRIQDNNPFAALSALDPQASTPVGLIDILRAIESAKTDDKIKGIVLDLSEIESGYGKLTEIRTKLEEFKESGKFIYAYADYYQYKSYYLASVADSVFINPEGQMLFNGMVAEVTFFANTLKKLGVEMQVIRQGKFKGAVEPFVRESLSEENKMQIQAYVNSVYDATLAQIAHSRTIAMESLKNDANGLQLRSVDDFIQKRYIDVASYKDQFYSLMKHRMGLTDEDKVELVSVNKYKKISSHYKSSENRIAVIFASGDIVGGKGDGTQIASEDMVATLKKVREDDKIKAAVLRIDSRGGSALASDVIWREVKLLADAKPLIVSMSDVAASGGYYIAAPAKTIVADATTITGSIGVFGLVPNAQKLLNDKLGLQFEYVGTGEFSDIGRVDRPLKAEEKEYITSIVDQIYDEFITKVSTGRNMSKEQIDAIAQGRIWTGVMAKEVGLVDELGGLDHAIKLAAKAANVDDYKVKDFPKIQDPFNMILDRMQGENSHLQTQFEQTSFGKYLKTMLDAEQWASGHSVQMMMPYDVKVKSYMFR